MNILAAIFAGLAVLAFGAVLAGWIWWEIRQARRDRRRA